MSESRGVVLVVGAARGIGRSIAEHLARSGYTLVLNDILDLGGTCTSLEIAGRQYVSIEGDINGPETIEQLHDTVASLGQPLVGAVNNAFAEVRKDFMDLTNEDWNYTWNSTFMTALNGSRIAATMMLPQKKGSIVNISSIHAVGSGGNGFAPYEAAKAAVNALTRFLAVEFGPHGIRVNAVLPGLILTDRNRTLWDEKRLQALLRAYPLRRPGTEEDIARCVGFLLSDDSSFTTGATIPVDGGLLAALPEVVATSGWPGFKLVREPSR